MIIENIPYYTLCPGCGMRWYTEKENKDYDICVACQTKLIILGTCEEITNEMNQKKSDHLIPDDIKEYAYIELYYKPLYFIGGKEKELEEYRKKGIAEIEESVARHIAESHAQFEATRQSQQHKPKCPTCSSYNVQRIGTMERGVSIAFLGLFSGKIAKTMKCKDCGYMW